MKGCQKWQMFILLRHYNITRTHECTIFPQNKNAILFKKDGILVKFFPKPNQRNQTTKKKGKQKELNQFKA